MTGQDAATLPAPHPHQNPMPVPNTPALHNLCSTSHRRKSLPLGHWHYCCMHNSCVITDEGEDESGGSNHATSAPHRPE